MAEKTLSNDGNYNNLVLNPVEDKLIILAINEVEWQGTVDETVALKAIGQDPLHVEQR